MSDNPQSEALMHHARLLMGQRRFPEAEGKLREALQGNPDDATTLHLLAYCQYAQDQGEQRALVTVRDALAQRPNSANLQALHARILMGLNRKDEALAAAQSAISLDPNEADAHNAMTFILLRSEKWAEAEASARRALELDPDDSEAANYLAHALRVQNKLDENADQIRGMLARDPDDAHTHASAGWSALQRGERKQAEEHFLESLRLAPGNEAARDGLLQSFRSRSPLYRGYLKWCFFMQRLSHGQRWALIIGLYVFSKFARTIFTGPMAPVGIAVALLYTTFVLWSFLARGIGSLLLVRDRFARHILTRAERLEAFIVGGGAMGGLLLGVTGILTGWFPCVIWGATGLALAVPASLVFHNESTVGRWLFGSIAAGAAGVGLLLGGALALNLEIVSALTPVAIWTIVAVMLCTWLSNVKSLHR